MLLFNQAVINYEPFSVMPCPTRLFVEGAITALEMATPHYEEIILSDLADQIGCDSSDLSFLIRPTPMDGGGEADLAVPDFRAVLTGTRG